MWVMNISYWGFNQYIIQRALAAKSVREAQKGIVLAAFLKLPMPVIIVLPGIAGVALAPNLARPDEAYPHLMAKPLLGSFDQAFQYIQEFTGFFTAGALVAAIASFVLSRLLWRFWPSLPFMDRVGLVFLVCLAFAVVISLAQSRRESPLRVELTQIDYSTSAGFNVAALAIAAILTAPYTTLW
jgi:solute:Na+ symporter, SSS family